MTVSLKNKNLVMEGRMVYQRHRSFARM